jgi:hypothetical protein
MEKDIKLYHEYLSVYFPVDMKNEEAELKI